ncbi:MAG: hypothetical protein AAB650_01265, partial [Patescibacteria group bacterium]
AWRKEYHPYKLYQLIVVSSYWQLKASEPFWRHAAGDAYLQLHIKPVRGTGGWRTRLLYAGYAALIRVALATGTWHRIEPLLWRLLYAGRYTKGFKTNGCA